MLSRKPLWVIQLVVVVFVVVIVVVFVVVVVVDPQFTKSVGDLEMYLDVHL